MTREFALNLEKVAKDNPKVDLDDLRESLQVQEQLRQEGYVKRGFHLTTPFERVQNTNKVKNEKGSSLEQSALA